MNQSDQNQQEKKIKINIFGKAAKLFIDQFQLTLLLMMLIVAIGIVGLLTLPKESLPEIVFPAITIQTLYPGASPEDVEALVTEKIENKVKDLDDIDTVESETGFGISVVTVTFQESVDIDRKKIEVDNNLRELAFPDGVFDPASFVFSTSEIPLMNISVAGDYDLASLTAFAELIQNEVEGVAGVDSVTIDGTVAEEIEVVLNELEMMKYGISFAKVRDAIQSKNFDAPLGELSLNDTRYNLRVKESYESLEEIENTQIQEGIYIKDIGYVTDGFAPITSYNRTFIRGIDDKAKASVFLTVSRKVNSDVISSSEGVKKLLSESQGTLYPEDLTVYVSNDLAVNVNSDLEKIQSSAWSGLLVVIIVLFLFIGIKESMIVATTIPLSLLGTLGVLNLFGITFNTFAVLGLIVALGLLVDNSIIVMENIDRLSKKNFTPIDAAYYGANQVGYPVSSATMTTLAAFFPLAILPGILGAFVSTIPITIMITITVSLLVSLLITPSLSARILRGKKRGIKFPKWLRVALSVSIVAGLSYIAFLDIGSMTITYVMVAVFSLLMFFRSLGGSERGLEESKLTLRYSQFIRWIAIKKWRGALVLLIGLLSLVASFSTFATGALKIAFFPVNEPTSLTITIDTVGGMTLDNTDAIIREIEDKLYQVDTIKQFNTTVGGSEIDRAVISVELDVTDFSGFESRERIEGALGMIPGAIVNIQGIASGPPVGKPLELQIIGDDLRASTDFADEIFNYIATIDGVYNIESSVSVGVPQLVFDINDYKALTYGISPIQVSNHLRGELNGVEAATFNKDGEEIDIVIRRNIDLVDSLEKVENLYIPTATGNMVPLSSIADIEEVGGISEISRKNGERIISVSADLKEGYNINNVVTRIKNSYPDNDIPQGVKLKYSGDVEGIEQNFGNLLQSMILAVFLVFIILTVQFKSIGQPFIILSTLPMAFIGVIWGLIITGNEFGFYAFMGLVALIGIAVNDAIVLIDYINYLRLEGMSVSEAIMEAGKTRFNPVLATTLTTISGVLPLAFKEAYYAQFSFALIFGLMVTTLLTLIFIPTIYSLFNRKKKEEEVTIS